MFAIDRLHSEDACSDASLEIGCDSLVLTFVDASIYNALKPKESVCEFKKGLLISPFWLQSFLVQ